MEKEIEANYNFNIPLELVEVFRAPGSSGNQEEWSSKILIGWEEIRRIETYAYPDDWKTYKGEKYFITLSDGQPKLVRGSYQSIKQHWTALRESYPIFYRENGVDKD